MGDANTTRATPGYVYGVAINCSGKTEEYTPECACPCHLADAPCPSSWYCNACWSFPMCITSADKPRIEYSHEQAIADGTANPRKPQRHVVKHYFITKGNNLDDALGERFTSEKKAEARAEELNTQDVIRSLRLTKRAKARRQRLKDLGWTPGFMSEAHPEQQLPRNPGQYGVLSWYDDGGSDWETEADLEKVRKRIEESDEVQRVVDLDSGEEIPFARTVSVELQT